MRISLKYRFAFMLLLILLIYTVGLFSYYRFYALEQSAQDLTAIKEHYASANDWFIKRVAELHEVPEAMFSLLEKEAKERHMLVQLFNPKGELIFQSDNLANRVWDFKSREVIEYEGEELYYLELRYPIQMGDVLGHTRAVRNMLGAAILFLSVGILFLIGYLQYVIVEPLLKLHRYMGLVNFRSTNVPSSYKNRPDEIGELFTNFQSMLDRLEGTRKEQITMMSAISHDLKTPLTSILGYVERLSDGKVKTEEKKQDYYEIIHRKAKDIETLVEEFSAFSRYEPEVGEIHCRELQARAFMEDICQEYREEVQGNQAGFSSRIDISHTTRLFADEKNIRRIFANLVSNALRYTDHPVHIHMTAKTHGDWAEFAVEDNGRGVPEEELIQIFKTFYRSDPSRSRESGGSGLGLAICKRIVEAHGGQIEAYRKQEGGFGVKFALPVVQS